MAPRVCPAALGIVAEDHGDYPLAEVRFADALTLFRAADADSNAAIALVHFGIAAWGKGNVERAEGLCQEAAKLQRASGTRGASLTRAATSV